MWNRNESGTIRKRRRSTPAGGSATPPSYARSRRKARSWSTASKKERHSKFLCRVINASPGKFSYVIFEQRRRGRDRCRLGHGQGAGRTAGGCGLGAGAGRRRRSGLAADRANPRENRRLGHDARCRRGEGGRGKSFC